MQAGLRRYLRLGSNAVSHCSTHTAISYQAAAAMSLPGALAGRTSARDAAVHHHQGATRGFRALPPCAGARRGARLVAGASSTRARPGIPMTQLKDIRDIKGLGMDEAEMDLSLRDVRVREGGRGRRRGPHLPRTSRVAMDRSQPAARMCMPGAACMVHGEVYASPFARNPATPAGRGGGGG